MENVESDFSISISPASLDPLPIVEDRDETAVNLPETLQRFHQEQSASGETPTAMLTGQAGTGKTFAIKQAIEDDPGFAQVCATTGIAGINLGTGTLNSALGFFDTNSLRDSYADGRVHRKLREIANLAQWLVVDEASMMPKQQLDLIHMALQDVNTQRMESEKRPLGLLLTGDFCQLAPIPGDLYDGNGRVILQTSGRYKGNPQREPTPWAFNAQCWEKFDPHIIKLTKIWRQSDPRFLDALNAVRKGAATAGSGILASIAEFLPRLNQRFDGTTIVAKNDEVDRINGLRLMDLPGKKHALSSERWWASSALGRSQPGEWKHIPEKLELKEGALVMILNNAKDTDEFGPTGDLKYCNGDLAHVIGFDFNSDETEVVTVHVRLVRNNREVEIARIFRRIEQKNEPEEEAIRRHPQTREDQNPYTKKPVWITGELNFFPLRLAYATSVHKSQGLSLDNVQIDPSSHFFGNPQMAYVALSRARTPGGLKIIGTPAMLARKINVDPILRERGFI